MLMNNENVVPNKTTTAKGKGGKSIEEMYTKMTQLEHILLRPDTYVGSIEKQTQQMWVLDKDSKQIEFKTCTFVPGLFKIFDEIIVNAADNKQRDKNMNKLDVVINVEEGYVRVWNNGQGIPVVIHQEHKIYVPELIFGNLLTGSNFNDEEEKTTGGRNGYGAKLANIFSTRFIVETADSSRQLRYKQEFSKNMSTRTDPQISKYDGTDFTCITFYPDLKRFKMDCLDEDIVGLLSKRVYDIAGTNTAAGARLNVFLNGDRVEAKTFEQYVSLYKGLEPPVAFEKVNERWEIGVGVSDGTFQQVSFVNSISTTKGGCHVNYIVDQVTSKLMGVVKKKNKGEEVKAGQIKNHLAIYVNCLIVNPAFDSQTKENLTTKASAFGSTCVVSDKLMKLVEKSGVVDNILNWAKFKQTNDLKKKSGSKRSTIQGITKLDDANCAGTSKSSQCTLILTEGDSAKALAISGLGVVGRDFYGVFPLKGKLLNVREANHSILMKNEEVQNIVKILGLTFGKVYEDVSSLRYGHLMIMADQDHDGSHIKGLLINFLHHFWPSLLKIKGFMQQFITPIVKCSKGKKEETFFTIPEYHKWRESNDEGRGWHIKYYKGLGTSTSAEAKEYFSNLQTHEVTFKWDERADDMIDMAFAKKRVEDRKLWLLSMEKGVHMDYTAGNVTYDDFVNHELILFSHADNQRSIPHYMDGFKPSQRKVLFSCFKRNLKSEIKVAQLAGYVSEHSAYHHGEASLNQTIIGMAQNFIGSNNINLLSPNGQFGTRLMGGKDAASPRYVFTKLQKITRHIFHPSDDPLLEYLDDDGQSIEPLYYVPVIPMVLVNGSEGIGTGWSTSIPTYNPRDIIDSLRAMINGADATELIPWFRGFTGEVTSKTGRDSHNFVVSGTIEQINDTTVVISELPVGKWTTDYKQFLESVLIGGPGAAAAAGKDKDKEGESGPAPCAPFVKEFKENHTDTTVLFTVTCPAEKLVEFANEKGGLAKKFKLEGSCATSNMHMFDLSSQIQKFDGPAEVMREFYKIRLMYYDKRKLHLTQKLTEEWERLNNKMNFILAVIAGKLVVANRKKADIMVDLKMQGFRAFYEKNEESTDELEAAEGTNGYDYLLSMKIWSLTVERVNDLKNQRDEKRKELEVLAAKTAESLWLEDLDALELALDGFEAEIDAEKRQEMAARKKASKARAGKTGGSKKAGKKSKKYGSDDESEMDEEGDEEEYDSEFEAREKAKRDRANAAAAAKRKAAAEALTAARAAAASAAASQPVRDAVSAPSVTASAAAPRQVQPKITKVFQREEVLPDREVMSLADRLKATALNNSNKTLSVASTSSAAPDATSKVAAKPKAAPKAAAAATGKAAAPKKAKKAALSDSEDDIFGCDEEEEEGEGLLADTPPPAVARPARAVRAAAVVKKLYTLDSDLSDGEDDSEADDDEEEEQEESDVSDAEDDDSEDFDSDDYSTKKNKKQTNKGGKKVAAPVVKPAAKAVTKVTAPVAKAAAAVPIVPSTAAIKTTPIKKTGVKRSAKSSSASSSSSSNNNAAIAAAAMEMFSPGKESPKPVKKAKSSSTAATAPKAVKPKAAPTAKKPAAAATSGAKKTAAAPKKKKAYDSDDAEFDDEDESGPPLASMRSPKPVRARKTTNYKAMYGDDDSMDDFIASEESEFDE